MTDLPQGWQGAPLEEVLETTIGGVWGGEAGSDEVDVDVLRVTELKANGLLEPSTAARRSVSAKQVASRSLKVGDIILEKSGGGPKSPVGRVGRITKSTEGFLFSNFMQLLRPNASLVLPNYLFEFLVYFQATSQTAPMQTATTNIRNIKMPAYLALSVPLPPLAEQERIVEILEEQFSRLDSALASVKAVREKAKAFRRSLLHSAFSGELTGGTEGWREVALGEVADVLDSKRKPVNSKERAGRAGSVPYYGATGQVGTIDTHLFDEELVLLGEDGAPFLDLAKPKAYLISGKSWVNNHAHVLRCREGVYTNTLLVHFLNDLNYLPYVNGTTRLKLTQGSMNEIPVTVPPLAEQERIVEILEEQFSRLDKALEVANQLEARIASERRSLLHSAFTGALTSTWRQNND